MRFLKFSAVVCAGALSVGAVPAQADEFTDVVNEALLAYEEGDIEGAKEELDYAVTLLADMKSETLREFLPEAMDGWTRTEGDTDGAGMGMAMFGGGNVVAAEYTGSGENLTITLVANSPMVSSLGAMITGMASMGGGKPIRIQRVTFAQNDEELQGIVDDRVLVTVAGNASLETKKAYLEAMDLRGLRDF
ncbi:hypothetical protein [Amaricoccus tamworthensis]|uniref:hypothetical protein n=1 Tax=Amaricoccus tamworthensis TaxID=57002 RepID=UPI003C7AD7EF